MKLLVTGGAGFIGSNFIQYWFEKHPKDSIVNLDTLTYAGNLENLASVEKNSRYSFIKGNICDQKIVDRAMKGVDRVVHFAAETHVDRSIMNSDIFLQTNIIGTKVLLESALKYKVQRFHHVSTDEVFGELGLSEKRAFHEQSAYNPRNPYSASKAASDHIVRSYFHTHGLPITISNTANNFGPYQFPEKFIALAITNILENKKVPVYGDGLHIRPWLYVLDHCFAIDRILEKGKAGETYCVGGVVENIHNIDVIKKILLFLGKDEGLIKFVKDRPGHDRRYAIDWSKAQKELGYEPKHSFEIYLEKTIRWYKDNEQWWRSVKSGEYQKYYKEQYGGR